MFAMTLLCIQVVKDHVAFPFALLFLPDTHSIAKTQWKYRQDTTFAVIKAW